MCFSPREIDREHIHADIDMIMWHEHFLKMARLISERSKDRSTKCGCVIVRNKRVLATGYNGFPSGTEDYDNDAKNERPEKYLWFEHSERNAIYNAASNGVALCDSTAYITCPPCVDCTRALIQSGIVCIIIPKKHNFIDRMDSIWAETAAVCEEMMRNAFLDYLCLEIDDA